MTLFELAETIWYQYKSQVVFLFILAVLLAAVYTLCVIIVGRMTCGCGEASERFIMQMTEDKAISALQKTKKRLNDYMDHLRALKDGYIKIQCSETANNPKRGPRANDPNEPDKRTNIGKKKDTDTTAEIEMPTIWVTEPQDVPGKQAPDDVAEQTPDPDAPTAGTDDTGGSKKFCKCGRGRVCTCVEDLDRLPPGAIELRPKKIGEGGLNV